MMYDHLPQIDSAAVQRPESTHELWLELAWPTSGITPSARVWQDVDEVRAAYCELEASIRIPIWNMVGVPMGSWTVAGRYGRTLGDSSGGSGSSRSVYRSGLEHVDLWVATTLGYIPIDRMTLAFSIEGHLVFALEDEFKAEHGPADPWLGLTLTVIGPRCRPGKDICRE